MGECLPREFGGTAGTNDLARAVADALIKVEARTPQLVRPIMSSGPRAAIAPLSFLT